MSMKLKMVSRRVKTNVSEDDLSEQVFELNLATITLVKSRSKG